ncbi:hypothetical protein KDL29_04920 [bacterium]|nr:hypothetical protein [bacterium]MCB1220037.1 hypothetical protein [bacterium]UNM08656.1 MAG: hypothetical protein H7A35_01100 [Planctomycetales bacterium]
MDGDAETREDLQQLVDELKDDLREVYQYYHGDPPHLQKIFDRWFPDGPLSSYPFG